MNSLVLTDYSSVKESRRPMDGEPDCDGHSEKTILREGSGSTVTVVQGKSGAIVRTTYVSLTVDIAKQHPKPRTEDWA